jgi:protocatechuate 3,4-dioxygenase beta subunit
LIDATAKAAAAIAAGGAFTDVVPAALSSVVREELSAMVATKLKLTVTALATVAASAGLIGFVIAAAPRPKPERGPVIVAIARGPDEPKAKADEPRLAAKLSASGTVVDSDGKPISGARVILREWSEFRIRGMPQQQVERIIKGEGINDTLLETRTDAAGRFRFQEVPAPAFRAIDEAGKNVFPWDIVALAQGHGVAWAQLTPQNQRSPVTLKLGPEGILRGRVIEPEGKPVVGAKVQVFGIDPLGRPDEYGLGTDNRLNLSWSAFPLNAMTNEDGRFAIGGLSRDKVVTLIVTQPRHERLFVLAATTDLPQPDAVFSRTTENRMPVHTGEFTLTAKVADHVLSGMVVREADGKPAAGAQVIHGGTVINTDQNGRFQIEGLVAGKLELHVGPNSSDTGAVAVAIEIEMPATPKETQRTINLPRGLVVTGRVVESATGAGVEKALVDFTPKPEPGRTAPLLSFSKETGPDGRFQLVVPPSRGTVVLRKFPPAFPAPERRYTGQPEDPSYSREVEGRGGQTIDVADFKLTKGREVVLRVVDPDGRPLAGARVDVRDPNRLFNATPGRSDETGHYTIGGLAPDQSTVVDVIDAKESLGATVEIPDAEAVGAKRGELEVGLQPLLSLSGRVLAEDGKPLSGGRVQIFRNVRYPGQSGRSFGVSIEIQNEIKGDGTYTFDRLIAGATYNTQVEVNGYPNATSNHVTLKAGGQARFNDFHLPAVDQEVNGVVVDARGRPLAGITVSYQQRTNATNPLYAPRGGTWFQDTNEAGRFHLTALPRGPIRLMVYRNPHVAHSQIKDIKYADVTPGTAEVRIEMPDANDRLRGIE